VWTVRVRIGKRRWETCKIRNISNAAATISDLNAYDQTKGGVLGVSASRGLSETGEVRFESPEFYT
jgi:hypothetical protein